MSVIIIVNFKAGLDYSKSVWGVTNNVEIISKYMERASFWCISSATIARKIWAPKLEPIFKFPKSCQLSKLCSSKTNGVTTSLESVVFLLSSNISPSFIAHCVVELQLLKVPSSRSCLSRSGFTSLLLPSYHSSAPQIYRSSRVLSQLSADRVWCSHKLRI